MVRMVEEWGLTSRIYNSNLKYYKEALIYLVVSYKNWGLCIPVNYTGMDTPANRATNFP